MTALAYKRAKVCYFYGWTHDYTNELDLPTFQDYWLAMDGIVGEDIMTQLNVASYPHWKSDSARKKFFKYAETMRSDMIETPKTSEVITTESIFGKLTGKFGEWHKKKN